MVGGYFFGGIFGCRAVFRYFPHQLRFSHSLGGFTVNRAFFTIFRQAEGGGRRAVFTRGHLNAHKSTHDIIHRARQYDILVQLIPKRLQRRGANICSPPVFPSSVHFPPPTCHPSTHTGKCFTVHICQGNMMDDYIKCFPLPQHSLGPQMGQNPRLQFLPAQFTHPVSYMVSRIIPAIQ